ncbi:MAG: IS630 family transposase [Verrucomicrobiota bacterium JB025]
MPKALPPLKISPSQMTELQSLSRSRTGAGAVALRARMMLQAAEGESNRQIGLRFGVKAHTVGTWRSRFESKGCEGLRDLQRPGRPAKITPAQKQKIVHTVCRKPPSGLGRWSVRSLAKRLGINRDAVHSTLVEHDLQPHRLRTFNFSPDPRFEEKLLDVVGLYMTPPENALVLCVDEKTGIQALDRTQPMLPLKAGKPRTWSNEYVRHGTRALLASLDISTGEVVAQVTRDRKSSTFLRFLDELTSRYQEQRLCVVMDNLNTHTNKAAMEWLERHPLVSFHYTPTHASWVNLVECFFSILTRTGLQQQVHKSGRALEKFLKSFVETYNQTCGPFTWTKGPEKLSKIIKLTQIAQQTGIA